MPFDIIRSPVQVPERRQSGEVELAQRPGRLAAARIEAASYATHVGLSHTAMLSALEGRLLHQVPLAEPRLKAIVDSYATYVCQELALLAYR